MRIVLAILMTVLISQVSYAEKKIRVFTNYDPPRFMVLAPGADFDLEASKAGNKGAFIDMERSEIPVTDQNTPQESMSLERGKIVIDGDKKNKIIARKTKRLADRMSAIEKFKAMGLTDDELKSIGLEA